MAFKLANLETFSFRHYFDKLIIFIVDTNNLVNFTECIACWYYTNSNGPIKIFLSSFTKGNICDNSVTDINPKFNRPCPDIEIHIVMHLCT